MGTEEEKLLFDKKYTCPVCEKEFTNKTVRSGKIRKIGADEDLRPIYADIEPLKYGVVMCPACGYTAIERFFSTVTVYEKQAIKDKITPIFKAPKEEGAVLTYDEALRRHKLALANVLVKDGKASEKAYTGLKIAWLLRSMGENLSKDAPNYESMKAKIDKEENDYLKAAKDDFLTAISEEDYPICGMDEPTLDYLLVNLAARFEEYDLAFKLLGGILTSPYATPRIKDKARDLKDELMKKAKK